MTKLSYTFLFFLLVLYSNILLSQKYAANVPEIEYTAIDDYYFIGEEVQCTARIYSYGLVDNLCAIFYEVYKDDFTTPISSVDEYGHAEFTVRGQGNNYVTQTISSGSGYLSVKPMLTTYTAFTLGIFDNWCVSRDRPIAISLNLNEAGMYRLRVKIQKCSNSGSGIFTSFTSNGNEYCTPSGTSHSDKVASSCTSPETLFVSDVTVSICNESEIVFLGGDTEYCSGDELLLTYRLGDNDDMIDQLLLPDWINVDFNEVTKIASLTGIVPDYDANNPIIEFDVKSMNSNNPVACPGAIITQNITVRPSEISTQDADICQGGSYTFFGQEYSEAGTYEVTVVNSNGCNDKHYLNLNVNPNYDTSLDVQLCAGESYVFAGETYTANTSISHTFTTINGCDSVVNLNLEFIAPVETTINDAICQGESYLFGEQEIFETGEYTLELTSANGCDSIVKLNLTVNPVYNTLLDVQLCAGDSYGFAGETYTENTNISHTFTSIHGCDSVINLNLEFIEPVETHLNDAICQGESYLFGEEEIVETGEYTLGLTSANGCDSIVTLNLTVNPIYNTSLDVQLCAGDSYEFAGETYTENTNIAHTFTTIHGCDSVVNLSLEFVEQFDIHLNKAICEGESYLFGEEEVFETGEYTLELTSVYGCDSIVTLNLTVNPVYNTSIDVQICAGESYEFAGETYTENTNVAHTFTTIHGCDSVVNMNLTVNPTNEVILNETINEGETYVINGQELTETGEYVFNLINEFGCDSTVTLNLTVVTQIFTNEILESQISVFPNPTNSILFIEIVNVDENIKADIFVSLTDVTGKEIISQKRYNNVDNLDLSTLKSGIYFLNIYLKNSKLTTKLIMKE